MFPEIKFWKFCLDITLPMDRPLATCASDLISAFPIKNINNFSNFFFLLFNRIHLMIRSTNDFWPIITNWTFTLFQSPISEFWIVWIWSIHETFGTDHVITADINMKFPLILISLKICFRRLTRLEEPIWWHIGDTWLGWYPKSTKNFFFNLDRILIGFCLLIPNVTWLVA